MDFDSLSQEERQTNLGVVAPNLNNAVSNIPSQVIEAQDQALNADVKREIQQPLNETVSQVTSQVGDITQVGIQNTSSSQQKQILIPNNQQNEQDKKNENNQLAKSEPNQSSQSQDNGNQQQLQTICHNEMLVYQQIQLQQDISKIVNKYESFFDYQDKLNNILIFSPKPSVTDENDDSQIQYVKNINKLKENVYTLLEFPIKYNKLQNSFSDTQKEFNRIHMLLCSNLCTLVKLTYKINQTNLGSNFQKLKEIEESLNLCLIEGQGLQDSLQQMVKVNHLIQVHFSSFFGEELSNFQDDLLTLNEKLKCQTQQRDLKQNEALQFYCEANLVIAQKNSIILTLQTASNILIQDIEQINEKIKKLQEKKNKKFKQIEGAKDQYLKQLNDEKDKLMQDKQAYQEKRLNNQEDRLNKYEQQVKSLNQKYPLGKMCSFVEKKCFHYFFVQDESGSFSSDHQYAIQGVTQLFNRIQPNDYITYIKFDDQSYINIPKTLKSSLSQGDFISKIQNCRGGGTSFYSAFQTLLQQIQLKYDQQEYPIVIFITDGQDSTNLDQIISQITNTCQDFIFYTIGYGRVHEQYLKNITNKFNNTVDEKKQINGKKVDLFYNKNTPSELVQSLSLISQQQSLISIEDIEKAKQFFKDSFEQMRKTADEYYTKTEDSFDKKIGLISSQISELQNQDIIDPQQLQDTVQQEIQKQNQYMNKLKEEESQVRMKIEEVKAEIENIKLNFLNNIDQQKSKKLEETNIEEELSNKQKDIENAHKKQIDDIQQQINNAIKNIQDNQQQKVNNIKQLGFKNYQQFKKFNEVIDTVQNSQLYQINLIQDILSLIKQLKAQNNTFNDAIETSQTNLMESSKFDSWYNVFTQFKQIDESINPENNFSSFQKVLFIMNSSIQQRAQNDKELQDFYNNSISNFNYDDIVKKYVNESKEEQDKYINEQVIPTMIKESKQLALAKINKDNLEGKIRKKQKEITNLKSNLKEEVDKDAKKDLQGEIKDCESDLKNLKKELDDITKDLDEIQYEFEQENSIKITTLKDIVYALIKSVEFALFKKKQIMASAPFYQLLKGDQNFVKALQQYKPLAIERGSSQ